MKKINTKPFGEFEIDEKQIIQFPFGVPGFESLHEFALLDSGQPPFYWLQSLEDVDVAFILINPFLLRYDYEVEVPDSEYESIELDPKAEPEEQPALIFSIVTVRGGGAIVTANLQAPVIINRAKRMGRQCISTNPDWDIRTDILDVLETLSSEDANADTH